MWNPSSYKSNASLRYFCCILCLTLHCSQLSPDHELSTHRLTGRLTGFREEKLIDDDIVRVNLVRCQFLDKTFSLVKWQELRDANTNKGRLFLPRQTRYVWSGKSKKTYGIFKLSVDFCKDFSHCFQFGKHVFLGCSTTKHRLHLQISRNGVNVGCYWPVEALVRIDQTSRWVFQVLFQGQRGKTRIVKCVPSELYQIRWLRIPSIWRVYRQSTSSSPC